MLPRAWQLIDTNEGERFSAELLKRWRALHETRIDRERLGLRTELGWVEKLELSGGLLFQGGTELSFGTIDFIARSQWHGEDRYRRLARRDCWSSNVGPVEKVPTRFPATQARLNYYAPEPQCAELEITAPTFVRRYNNSALPRPLPDLSMVYLRQTYECAFREDEDVAKIAKAIGVEPHEVLPLAEEVTRWGGPFSQPVHFRREDEDGVLKWRFRRYQLSRRVVARHRIRLRSTLPGREASTGF